MSDVIAIEEKDITVSNLIDISRIDKSKINFVEAGTGTGKTFWALKTLPSKLDNIRPEQILFVTSRSITKYQQLIDEEYKDIVRGLDNNSQLGLNNYANFYNALMNEETNAFGTCYDNIERERIAHMVTYNFFKIMLEDDISILNELRLIVLDEFHSILTDAFNKEAQYVYDIMIMLLDKNKEMQREIFGLKKHEDLIIVGMSATTDDFKYNRQLKKLINNLLDTPYYKYKITESINLITSELYLDDVIKKSKGKTLFMSASAKDSVKFANKYHKARAIVSKTNKDNLRTDDMDKLEDYICKYKKLPDEVDILIGTSCIREGFEFTINNNIENIIVESSDPVAIKQFIGRYRGNIKNLYILNSRALNGIMNSKDKNKKPTCAQIQHYYEFRKLVNKESFVWLNHLENIVQKKDESLYKRIDEKDNDSFIEYIKDNWLNVLIYTDEQKNEIISHAHLLGIRGKDRNELTFNYIKKIIINSGIEVVSKQNKIKGKRYTTYSFN